MKRDDNNDVLIIGAGPTGLTMAIELARRGIKCRIVDKLREPLTYARASIIKTRMLEILSQMGVISPLIERGIPVREKRFFIRGERILRISYESLDSPFDYLLSIGEQDTERILTDHLSNLGVEIERGVELLSASNSNDGVDVVLRRSDGSEENIRVGWLIGCDGAHSGVRHALGESLEGHEFPETNILGLLRLKGWLQPDGVVAIYCDENIGFTCQQFPEGYFLLLGSAADSGAVGEDTEESLLALWQDHLDRVNSGLTAYDPVWMARFNLHDRIVPRFRSGRIFLAGDAAHLCPQISGLGMNTSIQDTYNLAWKLSLVISGESPESLLDSYEMERRPIAEEYNSLSSDLELSRELHDFGSQEKRNYKFEAMDTNVWSKRAQVEKESQITENYRNSPIVKGHREEQTRFKNHNVQWPGPWPGDRLPDTFPLITKEGEEVSLYEIAWNPTHTLLILAGEPTNESVSEFSQIHTRIEGSLGSLISTYLIVEADTPLELQSSGMKVLADPTCSIHAKLGVTSDTLMLIRPDGYIGFRSEPPDEEALFLYLGSIFNMN